MLSQIVRPMVRTQIRMLASSQATRDTLIGTVAQWLGFLGVKSQVTHLEGDSDQKIRICLTVDKPEGCDNQDWQQILHNINKTQNISVTSQLTPQQQSKLQRLFAYLIQVAEPELRVGWDVRYGQLKALGLDEQMLLGIKSALKIPQSLQQLMQGLDAELAAIALPKAVSIVWLDGQVNPDEDDALTALLQVMKQPAEVQPTINRR